MKLCFLWVGKTRSAPIRSLLDDYLGRLSKFAPVAITAVREGTTSNAGWTRTVQTEGEHLLARIKPDDLVVVLDSGGRQMTSGELANYIDARMQAGVKQITFVVGGHAGVHSSVKQRADLELSLGPMTLTHEMARVLLAEQVYRAFTIIRNLPYQR
jgi:23S rRNA (pseudouridine1915-N3)-methyltransferase